MPDWLLYGAGLGSGLLLGLLIRMWRNHQTRRWNRMF